MQFAHGKIEATLKVAWRCDPDRMRGLRVPAQPAVWSVSCVVSISGENCVIEKFIATRCASGTRAGATVCRLAPLAAAVAMGFTGSASAATILVNAASAAGGVPGSCTLVDAATSINQASLVGSCTNSGGAF